MKKLTFVLIIILSVLTSRLGAQCVIAGGSVGPMCQGSTSPPLLGSYGLDATGAIWTADAGGSFANNAGNSPGSATWTPPPGFSGIATLTLTAVGGTCIPNFVQKSITVTALPSAPGGSATQNFCSINLPTIASFVASGSGLLWYSASSGGSPLSTSTVLLTGTTYYASQTVSGCESTARLAVAVTVADPAPPTGTSPQTFCSINLPTIASISVTGSGIKWYAASTGGSPLATTTALINNTLYYASQTVSGCESTTRLAVTAIVNDPAAPTGTSPQAFCSINLPTIASLVVTGTSVKWYAASTGGSALASTTALVNNTIYYASQTLSGCESDTRLAITATISDPAAPTGTSPQTFCSINLPTVANLVATGTAIKWYAASTGGSPLASTTALVNNTIYYASQTVGVCESDARLAVTATVSDPVAPTGTSPQSFCSSISPTVASLTATGSGIKWYTASSGGAALATTTALVNNTTYYASQTIGTCESDLRLPVTVNLLANNTITRSSALNTDAQTVCANSAITNITYSTTGATGATITGLPAGITGLWASNVVTISGSSSVAGLHSYTVTLTGGCGTATASGTITVTALPVATFSYTTTPYCSSESNPLPTFSGGGVAGTFSSTSGLVFVSTASGQVNLSGSTPGTYTVTNTIPSAGGCGIVTATSSITITAAPNATITYTGSPWCTSDIDQHPTLTGTTGGTYSSSPAGLSIVAANGTISPPLSTAGTYTVTYTVAATGGCGISTFSTSVTISPSPTAPTVGAVTQTTCSVATGSVVLGGMPTTGNGTWLLTRNPGGVTTAGSGTSTTVSGLAPGSYTFTVANSAGCVSPLSGTVTINTQPASPAAPVSSVDCSAGFGHAIVTVTSPTGPGLEYSLDGSVYVSTTTFISVNNGSHYLSVRNAAGCTTTGSLFSVSCGCVNPPVLTLSSSSGSTCGVTPVTVTGNTFSGSATGVTVSSDGAGILNPVSVSASPFSFTYTPAASDGGKKVIITFTTNNPLGNPCTADIRTYTLTVNAAPVAPAIGTITNLTCSVATGSVVLNSLPGTGTWTLIRNPGAILTNGTGISTTVSSLVAGTYNFIVTSAEGCTSPVSADAVITPAPLAPTAPVVGTITQPTCANSTGSVILSGLPASGSWTLTRSPGNVTISSSGTSITISSLPSGTYTFSVTNSTGCTSSASGNVVINPQPSIPTAPVVGTITPPSCVLATGSVLLTGLPATGTWTLVRYPGTISFTGSGTSSTISGLTTNTYNFTVTSAEGCLSVPSGNVVIPAQPATPSAPTVGTITQPTFAIPTGSVVLSGLPSSGAWIITQLPGGTTTSGSGTSRTISNLAGGVFTFTVANSSGCTSAESIQVTISTPGTPVLTITNPPTVCSPATVDLTNNSIIAGSTPGLTYTYWLDAAATIAYTTPTTATANTYYIKGTTVSGYFSIKPVVVTIDQHPVANAGPDQNLDFVFSTTLEATLGNGETGLWSVFSGTADFSDNTNPNTTVNGLSAGDNLLLWSVKTNVCPAVTDTVNIIVSNLVIPTLITPNMDGRNDFFVIRGLSALGKSQLVIFDRRGAQVYKNLNYDNSWNGVDYNGKSLPDDTYFFVLNAANGKATSGYIVIRR